MAPHIARPGAGDFVPAPEQFLGGTAGLSPATVTRRGGGGEVAPGHIDDWLTWRVTEDNAGRVTSAASRSSRARDACS